MHCSGSRFAQGTAPAPAQEGSLVYPTGPGAAGVDGVDTVHNVQGEMYGARGEVERVEGGRVPVVDMYSGVASRNHVEPIGHGSGSTYSRPPLPVAVRGQGGLCLHARQRCWVLLGPVGVERNCHSQGWPEVLVLHTNKTEYEKGCSVKTCLVGEEVAEVGDVDTVRTLADSG